MVSSASTTGATSGFGSEQDDYFQRINNLALKNPQIVGFGIKDMRTFDAATRHAKGAIIGSAFIKMLDEKGTAGISEFIASIRPA